LPHATRRSEKPAKNPFPFLTAEKTELGFSIDAVEVARDKKRPEVTPVKPVILENGKTVARR
jgi:hypothetical protein